MELVGKDRIIFAIALAYYVLALLVELLPIISKSLMRSVYEYRMAVRARCAAMEAEIEIALGAAKPATEQLEAQALVTGARRFHEDTMGESYYQATAIKAQFSSDSLMADAIFRQIEIALANLSRAASMFETAERRHSRDPLIACEVERLRGMFASIPKSAGLSELRRHRRDVSSDGREAATGFRQPGPTYCMAKDGSQ
jgi:hypothetical protein